MIPGLATAILLLILVAAPVLASDPPTPDVMQVESVSVTRNLTEEGDRFVAFHHTIHYDSGQPETPANKLFTFRLIGTDNSTHLASVVPYAYYNSGYDQGCSGFYFPAADNLTWGQAYILRISGNPEYFADPPVTNYTLTASDYSQVAEREANQAVLGNYIIDAARKLETNWSTMLLTEGELGTVLNSTGEAYFRGTISALQVMAPQIFLVRTETPGFEPREWTEEQAKTYEERFTGTWVGKSIVAVGKLFHVKWNVITGMMVLGAVMGLAVVCEMSFKTVKPAMISGACILIGGTVMGWVAPALMAIITLVAALYLGYFWFFRHG